MRLLCYNRWKMPELREFDRNKIPPYAIVSHTWDGEEVTYENMEFPGKTARKKKGWRKVYFCLDQAEKDGLQFCWIDSCCINRPNFTELSEAINSMFRFYRDAEKSYIYPWDVSQKRIQTG